jgi:hypothetical protein
MTAAEPSKTGENTPEPQEKSPVAPMVTEKAAAGDVGGAAAQQLFNRALLPGKLKKSSDGLNVRAAHGDQLAGAEIPPHVISGASAHPPQAPYDLDPSGCPPGRVFP